MEIPGIDMIIEGHSEVLMQNMIKHKQLPHFCLCFDIHRYRFMFT